MKLNWKVRFRNKTWLTMFISLVVGFIFNMLKLFDVVPSFSENLVMNIVGQVLTFLGLIGVIVDPTTAGIEDSNRDHPRLCSAERDVRLHDGSSFPYAGPRHVHHAV